MKTRERYWGLYDYEDKDWLTDTSPIWQSKPSKRRRFDSRKQALEYAKTCGKEVTARPFYVTRRARPRPAEAQALIDAVKRFNSSNGNWTTVMDAVRDFEVACSTSSSS